MSILRRASERWSIHSDSMDADGHVSCLKGEKYHARN
jgi:hypothetical protein